MRSMLVVIACFVISAVLGSAKTPGEFYLMTDVPNAGKKAEDVGPCSLLLYRLEYQTGNNPK